MKKIDKRKNNGGYANCGRKKVSEEEKKIPICRYYKRNDIDALGGKDALNEAFDKVFENKLKEIKK